MKVSIFRIWNSFPKTYLYGESRMKRSRNRSVSTTVDDDSSSSSSSAAAGGFFKDINFWEVFPILNCVLVACAMTGLFCLTLSQIWKHHGTDGSRAYDPANPVRPVSSIYDNVPGGELSISVERASLYDTYDMAQSRNAEVLREGVLRPDVHSSIKSMLLNRAYWFFDEANPNKFIWTWSYVERTLEPSHEIQLRFQMRENSTRNASLVGFWCEPWEALYNETAKHASNDSMRNKLAVVFRVHYNASLSAQDFQQVQVCLALQPIDGSLGHVGFFRSRRSLRNITRVPALTTEATSRPSVISSDQTTTEPPTTQQPTTEAPTSEPPATKPPTTEPSTTKPPTTQQRTTEQPTIEPATTEQPTTEPPKTKQPTTEQPTTEQPTTEQPTTEPPTTASTPKPTTTPPYDALGYIDSVPSTDYDGKFFAIRVFNKLATYYETAKICQQLTDNSKAYSFTLIERITQQPSYLHNFASHLDSVAHFLAQDDQEHLIWTGARFDLTSNNPNVLWLPNGEKRLKISILNDELCEDSKNFEEIIESQSKENDGSSQYLHIVVKYQRGASSACLKLLDAGNSFSTLLPACQYERYPAASVHCKFSS